MASLVSRLVACLVAVVAVLQLVHLVLLNQLESRRLGELHHLQNHGAGAASAAAGRGSGGGGGLSFSGMPAGQDHPRSLASIINGQPQRLTQLPHDDNDIPENEELAARLLREDEGTIVDSTGEFQIVFDLAGPRAPSSAVGGAGGGDAGPLLLFPRKQQQQQPQQPPEQNDDFSIDDEIDDRTDVTLVTQGDLTNAKAFLLNLVERWQGPISLVLFARNSSEVEWTLGFIAQARRCHEWTRQYVSFHLVFPLVETFKTKGGEGGGRKKKKVSKSSSSSSYSSSSSGSFSSSKRKGVEKGKDFPGRQGNECQNLIEELEESRSRLELGLNSFDDLIVYPVNLLRNVARKRVMSEFSFVTDIDMLPSNGLRSKFQKFARDKQLDREGGGGDEKKSVFVVPAFESKNGEAPGSKRELLQLIEKYQVRPFYFDLCWKCQVHTDYETWQRERESRTGDLSVLFEVLWKDPWEPFFISHNSVPLLDERFRQHGFNRISQLCELHVAGFKFSVLNDAFLIHQGYKTTQSFHPARTRQVELNRVNFRQFKIELKDKYPHSTRRCY